MYIILTNEKGKKQMKNNFEDTIIIKNQEIKNSELKKYLQFRLGKDDFEVEDLKEIEEIRIDGKTFTGEENVVYFDEINLFSNLKEIELNNLNIGIDEIQKLNNIEKITFKKCTIQNLNSLTKVKNLSLKSSIINNIEEIKELVQIEELELIDLEIDNFEFLRELKSLEKLKIKNVKEFELDKINFNMPIKYLSVENIERVTFEDMQKFTNLEYLSVDREEANKW